MLVALLLAQHRGATADQTVAELEAVGPVKTVIRPECPRFSDFTVSSQSNIAYDAPSATSLPNHMTKRLHDKLAALADLVADDVNHFGHGTKLRVMSAFTEAPAGSSVPSTHYEGRSADITLVGSPTSSQLDRLESHAAAAGLDYVARQVSDNNYPEHLHVSVLQDSCTSRVDLVFLLDGSGSIQNCCGGVAGNFDDLMLGFVKGMVDFFTVGQNESRVGAVTFSREATTNFLMNQCVGQSGAGVPRLPPAQCQETIL